MVAFSLYPQVLRQRVVDGSVMSGQGEDSQGVDEYLLRLALVQVTYYTASPCHLTSYFLFRHMPFISLVTLPLPLLSISCRC